MKFSEWKILNAFILIEMKFVTPTGWIENARSQTMRSHYPTRDLMKCNLCHLYCEHFLTKTRWQRINLVWNVSNKRNFNGKSHFSLLTHATHIEAARIFHLNDLPLAQIIRILDQSNVLLWFCANQFKCIQSQCIIYMMK